MLTNTAATASMIFVMNIAAAMAAEARQLKSIQRRQTGQWRSGQSVAESGKLCFARPGWLAGCRHFAGHATIGSRDTKCMQGIAPAIRDTGDVACCCGLVSHTFHAYTHHPHHLGFSTCNVYLILGYTVCSHGLQMACLILCVL